MLVLYSRQVTGPLIVFPVSRYPQSRVEDSVLSPCAALVSKSLKSNDDEACKLGVNRPHSLYKLLHIVIK